MEAGAAVAKQHDVPHNGLNFSSARKVEIEKPQGTIHTACIIVSFDYLHLPLYPLESSNNQSSFKVTAHRTSGGLQADTYIACKLNIMPPAES